MQQIDSEIISWLGLQQLKVMVCHFMQVAYGGVTHGGGMDFLHLVNSMCPK